MWRPRRLPAVRVCTSHQRFRFADFFFARCLFTVAAASELQVRLQPFFVLHSRMHALRLVPAGSPKQATAQTFLALRVLALHRRFLMHDLLIAAYCRSCFAVQAAGMTTSKPPTIFCYHSAPCVLGLQCLRRPTAETSYLQYARARTSPKHPTQVRS